MLQRRPFPKERTRVIIDSGRPFLTSADWLGPVHLRWGLCAGPPLIAAAARMTSAAWLRSEAMIAAFSSRPLALLQSKLKGLRTRWRCW